MIALRTLGGPLVVAAAAACDAAVYTDPDTTWSPYDLEEVSYVGQRYEPMPEPDGPGRVFDTSVLHEIVIDVDPDYLDELEDNEDDRVPCTFTFDGVTLTDVGIRKKGKGTQGGSLDRKPSISVKFNEFVKGQKLHGVDKLLLNNARADATFLHEPLGFDLYGRGGFPHRRNAHGVVTLVGPEPEGEVLGVYVMVEAVNDDFLEIQFGEEYSDGNLFEDEDAGDFAGHALEMDLKDPDEPGRSYDRLVEFAEFLDDASDAEFAEHLDDFVDVEQTLDSFALDLLSQHGDGFWHAAHNYYMYEHPLDERFIFIPHGMDLLFAWTGPCGEIEDPDDQSTVLGERLIEDPGMRTRLDAAIARMLDQAWDEELMEARIDELSALLDSSTHDEPKFLSDRDEFRESHAELRRIVRGARTVWLDLDDGVCGDGVLNGRELCAYGCDDGNLEDDDGCSSECVLELCEDDVVRPGADQVSSGETQDDSHSTTTSTVCTYEPKRQAQFLDP